MAETSKIKIQKIKVAGKAIYPATILDAVKDAKSVIVEGAETNANYGKTLREILDALAGDVNALNNLGITAEQLGKIATNEAAIATLNGAANEDGSVAKQINDAIAAISDADGGTIDKLQEVLNWFKGVSAPGADDEPGVTLIADVAANKTAIGEKAKAAEYYATYEEYVAAAEAEGWATEYTLKREFDDDAPDAGEKLKTGTGTAATGLYKEIEDAVEAASHAKTTVVTGATNGTVSVDGTDVAVKGLGSAAYTDSTAYDAAGAAEAVQGETTKTVKDLVDEIGVEGVAESVPGAGDSVAATGIYAKIDAAKAAAIAAQHSKTTVTRGTVDGSISVDGGEDIVICTLSAENISDTTEYADIF